MNRSVVVLLFWLIGVVFVQAQTIHIVQVLDTPVTDSIQLMDTDSLIFVNGTSSSQRFYVVNNGQGVPGHFPTPNLVPQGAVIYGRLVGTSVDFYMVAQAEGMANATATVYVDAETFTFGLVEAKRNLLKVYPNPFVRNFTIELEKGTIQRIEVYDVGGRLVQEEGGLGYNRQTIFTAGMAKGTYLVRVLTHEGETYHERNIRF